jgi:predicted ester cyclase
VSSQRSDCDRPYLNKRESLLFVHTNQDYHGRGETRAAFPDWHEEVLDIVAEGNMVMTRSRSTGTQKGEMAPIPGYQPRVPANGKFQRFPEMSVHRLANGKIAEQWTVSDNWGANIQRGLIDPSNWPASALYQSKTTPTRPSR